MGLFNFFRKKPSYRVEIRGQEPTTHQIKEQWRERAHEHVKNFQKDKAGLYPHEILLLSYYEKYAAGTTPAKFWEREYAVDDIGSLMRALEEKGFADGSKLTEAGKAEIKKNEYVLYMHRHKFYDISMSRMSVLVNKNPGMKFKDILWGEFNRLSLEYIRTEKIGLYRNTRYRMHQFLMEEKRYQDAFPLLAEAFFYDLNGSTIPFIAPAFAEDFRNISRILDYNDEIIIDVLTKHFDNIYTPFRNFSNDEVICIISAYAMGHDEIAQSVFEKGLKRSRRRHEV